MRLNNFIPFIIFAIVIVTLYFSLNISNSSKNYVTEVSKLELISLDTENKESLSLNRFHGKFYLLHLFASWCSSCKEDTELLNKIKNITNTPIIGVAIRDDIDRARLLKKKYSPYNYTSIDSDNKLVDLIKTKAVPQTIIINPEGIVVFHYVGTLLQSEVDNKIIPALLK